MSTMKELHQIMDTIINSHNEELISEHFNSLSKECTTLGTLLKCPLNFEYTLQRLIGGCLSRDPIIKFNAYASINALNAVWQPCSIPDLIIYILKTADISECAGVRADIESFIVGKILIFKALSCHLIKNNTVIQAIVKISEEFPSLEEQTYEVLEMLSMNRKKLINLNPQNLGGKIILKIITSSPEEVCKIKNSEIENLITECINLYPKKSIALRYIGLTLHRKDFIKISPAEYFDKLIFRFNEESDGIKLLFCILLLMQSHFNAVKIDKKNINSLISIKMIELWLAQLRVKNNRIRSIAAEIALNINKDEELALQFLTLLHENKIYLENISTLHPLKELYFGCEINAGWNYLLNLSSLKTEKSEEEIEVEEESSNYLIELEFYVRERNEELSAEQIAMTLSVLLNRYEKEKKESYLNLVWSLLNKILAKTNKMILHQEKAIEILRYINLSSLQKGEEEKTFLELGMKSLLILLKERIQEKEEEKMTYRMFIISLGFYCLVFPEEIEVTDELKEMREDIGRIIFKEGEGEPRKKRKLSKDVDPKKAVHVLIDIFIGLLTRAPNFLRKAIEKFFDYLIPELEASDIRQIFDVLEKPDQEYIEEF